MAQAIYLFIIATIVPIVFKVLVALGIGFVTYSGVTLGIDQISAFVESQFTGLPSYILQLIALMKVDIAISMLLAAYSAKLALQSVNGSISRFSAGKAGNQVGI